MKCVMRLSNDFHCLPRQVLTGRNDAKITMNRLQQSAMISNELSVYIYIYIIIVIKSNNGCWIAMSHSFGFVCSHESRLFLLTPFWVILLTSITSDHTANGPTIVFDQRFHVGEHEKSVPQHCHTIWRTSNWEIDRNRQPLYSPRIPEPCIDCIA